MRGRVRPAVSAGRIVVVGQRGRHRTAIVHRTRAARRAVSDPQRQRELVIGIRRHAAGDRVPQELRRVGNGIGSRRRQAGADRLAVNKAGRQLDGERVGIGRRAEVAHRHRNIAFAQRHGGRREDHLQVGPAVHVGRVNRHQAGSAPAGAAERQLGRVGRQSRAGHVAQRAGDVKIHLVIDLDIADRPAQRIASHNHGRIGCRVRDEAEIGRPGIRKHYVVRHVSAIHRLVAHAQPPGHNVARQRVNRLVIVARRAFALLEHAHARLGRLQCDRVFGIAQLFAARPKRHSRRKGLGRVGRHTQSANRHGNDDHRQRVERVENAARRQGRSPAQHRLGRGGHDDLGRKGRRRGDDIAVPVHDAQRERLCIVRHQLAQRLGDVELIERHIGRSILGSEDNVPQVAHGQVGRLTVVRQQIGIRRIELDDTLKLFAGGAETIEPGRDGDHERRALKHARCHSHFALLARRNLGNRKHRRSGCGDRRRPAERDDARAAVGRIARDGDAAQRIRDHDVGRGQIAVVGDKKLPKHILLANGVLDGRGKERQVGHAVDVIARGSPPIGDGAQALERETGSPVCRVLAVHVHVKLDRPIAGDVGCCGQRKRDDAPPAAYRGVGENGDRTDGRQRAGEGKVACREDFGDRRSIGDDDVIGQGGEQRVTICRLFHTIHVDRHPVGAAAIQDSRLHSDAHIGPAEHHVQWPVKRIVRGARGRRAQAGQV